MKQFLVHKIFIPFALWLCVGLGYFIMPLLSTASGASGSSVGSPTSIAVLYDPRLIFAVSVGAVIMLLFFQLFLSVIIGPLRQVFRFLSERIPKLNLVNTPGVANVISDDDFFLALHGEAIGQISGAGSLLLVASLLLLFDQSKWGHHLFRASADSWHSGVIAALLIWSISAIWYWIVHSKANRIIALTSAAADSAASAVIAASAAAAASSAAISAADSAGIAAASAAAAAASAAVIAASSDALSSTASSSVPVLKKLGAVLKVLLS